MIFIANFLGRETKLVLTVVITLFISVFFATTTFAAEAKQVSTGPKAACAVVDLWVKCWGSNEHSQLGTGNKNGSGVQATPVSVASNKTGVPATYKCGASFFGSCLWQTEVTPAQPASAMAGQEVTKVSVGSTHVCAVTNATVYCWGENNYGQLGNRSTSRATVPVAVDRSGNSAMSKKEIIDVSAGDGFTCALASDGTTACWGRGANGRLGNDNVTNMNYPVAVYKAGALSGKKGIRLAKANGGTMCVLAVNSDSTDESKGNPYCWGIGIDNGQGIPGNKQDRTACSKTSPSSKPSATTTKSTILESKRPTLVAGAVLTDIDSQDYVTGLGTDGKAYYWGMYGYEERTGYSNVTTCRVNPCTGKVSIAQDATLASWRTTKDTRKKTGPVGSRGDNRVKSVSTSAKKRVTTYNSGAQKVEIKKSNDNDKNCNLQTHYGFSKDTIYAPVGQKVTATPPSWPQAQGGITSLSGSVYNGLFCATTAAGAKCDTHGTSATEGQTGSGFVQTCGWSGFAYKCTPPSIPTGPQSVASNGWLAGKSITQLSTGSTGYTCAVASGSLGCWGVNTKGQLGVGDTKNKNVPTGVGL